MKQVAVPPPEGCEAPGLVQYFPEGQERQWNGENIPDSGRKLPTGQALGVPLP